MRTTGTGRCYIGSGQQDRKCSTGVCYLSHISPQEKYEAKCESTSEKTNITVLAIETASSNPNVTFNRTYLILFQAIQFRCESYQCNSLDRYHQIRTQVQRYYNLSSYYRIMSIEEQQENLFLNSTTTISQYANSCSSLSFFSVLLLFQCIVFLLPSMIDHERRLT